MKNGEEGYLNKWTQIFNLNKEISVGETFKVTKLAYKHVRWLLVNFPELFYLWISSLQNNKQMIEKKGSSVLQWLQVLWIEYVNS